MRYYTVKCKPRDYVVVKHQVSGINTEINGITYREGYGVVLRNSKEYTQLKHIRLAIASEHPIELLGKLKCVIRPSEIKNIWGNNVYSAYLMAVKADSERTVPLQDVEKRVYCSHVKEDGTVCKRYRLDKLTTCRFHVLHDPKLSKYLEDMPTLPKKDKSQYITDLIKKVQSE